MKTKKLFSKLFPTYFLISVIGLVVLLFITNSAFKVFYYKEISTSLTQKAKLIKSNIQELVIKNQISKLRVRTTQLALLSENRITVVLPNGKVIADSSYDPVKMENHAKRKEITDALKGKPSESMRFSPTLKEKHLYIAIPLNFGNRIVGALRTSVSVEKIDISLMTLTKKLITWSFFLLIFLTYFIYNQAKKISTPLEEMKRHVESFASSNSLINFKESIAITDSSTEEIASLIDAIKQMSNQLQVQFEKINRQTDEQIHVISKMRELENHRKEFVANVSHELKTPLTAIQGFLETIKEGVDDQETLDKFIDIILKHSLRLKNIIEDLLTLSSIERESEIGSLDMHSGYIQGVLENIISLSDYKAQKKGIKISLSGSDHECQINIPLIEQAIINLLDNAIKYGPENSKISVTTSLSDSFIQINVSDQGQGIDKIHHERLFERFYSVDKARSRQLGGSGLGLSIVKHIVLSHGGNVKIKSEPPNGSSFIIELPLTT
jgi:signal transduction histidine kinase